MAGHIFIVRGDMTRLACDAWLLPCDVKADPDLDRWNVLHRELFSNLMPPEDWGRNGKRVMRVPNWPADLPEPWWVHVGAGRKTGISWYIEGARQFLEEATAASSG